MKKSLKSGPHEGLARPTRPMTAGFFWLLAAGLALLCAMQAHAADRLLGKRDFERAAILYGEDSMAYLEGRGCGNRLSVERFGPPANVPDPAQDPLRCRLKFAPELDVPFRNFPVVMFFDRGARADKSLPRRPDQVRGVYIYRFDAGKLVNNGMDVFRAQPVEPGGVLKVKAGDVVTWSMIASNVEYDGASESIPLREIVMTPVSTRIHHCLRNGFNGCDPLNVRVARFGLCEGKVRTYDGKGALSTTSKSHFKPLGGTDCEAEALIDEGDSWLTVFHRFHPMPATSSSIASTGNSWLIEAHDPPGAYRIDVRLAGKLIGQLAFEVVR